MTLNVHSSGNVIIAQRPRAINHPDLTPKLLGSEVRIPMKPPGDSDMIAPGVPI